MTLSCLCWFCQLGVLFCFFVASHGGPIIRLTSGRERETGVHLAIHFFSSFFFHFSFIFNRRDFSKNVEKKKGVIIVTVSPPFCENPVFFIFV